MHARFLWAPLGAAFVACIAKPAPPPASEPEPRTEPAPIIAPEAASSPPATEPATSATDASTPTPAPSGSAVGALGAESPEKPSGRLPPEVIQRIVRKNYVVFRKCYEAGLGRNRELKGRVSARFVIGRDGSVSNVSNGGSDLPDQETIACVLKAFYSLRFPNPEGGTVVVVYPIMLEPG